MNKDSQSGPAPKPENGNKGNILPDNGAKWGTTPEASTLTTEEEKRRQQSLESYYTEEEKEKMRAKGINPLLRAEMNMNKSKEGSFWGKVGGTAFGGGLIK